MAYRDSKKNEMFRLLEHRMQEQGWSNITHFTHGSKIPYSVETVRRAFSDQGRRQLSSDTLAILCRYLGMNKQEIREFLKTYTDDNELWKLIGDEGEGIQLDIDEQAFLDIFRKIKSQRADVSDLIADNLSFLAKSIGIDISSELTILGRQNRKGR
jgi:hypothetical protein